MTFASDESLLFNGGQAAIEGLTSDYSRLTVTAVGREIFSLILNIDASADGFVSFFDGVTTSSLFVLSGNGQNLFTILGPFSSLTLTTYSDLAGTIETDLINQVQQVRLTLAVPEPETYALMLAGLAALGFVARKRNRSLSSTAPARV